MERRKLAYEELLQAGSNVMDAGKVLQGFKPFPLADQLDEMKSISMLLASAIKRLQSAHTLSLIEIRHLEQAIQHKEKPHG